METWTRLITIETDTPERMDFQKSNALVQEGQSQVYGGVRIFASTPPFHPSLYNIQTDQIEPVTQEKVDELSHINTAYGELRQAFAKAEIDRGLDPASALSDLLRTAGEVHQKLKDSL